MVGPRVGLIVSKAVLWELLFGERLKGVAVMVTSTGEFTVLVLILKVAEVSPAFTPTLAGSIKETFGVADNIIMRPPAGATPFRVTVPTKEQPFTTEAGDTVSVDTTSGLSVRVASPR